MDRNSSITLEDNARVDDRLWDVLNSAFKKMIVKKSKKTNTMPSYYVKRNAHKGRNKNQGVETREVKGGKKQTKKTGSEKPIWNRI